MKFPCKKVTSNSLHFGLKMLFADLKYFRVKCIKNQLQTKKIAKKCKKKIFFYSETTLKILKIRKIIDQNFV